MNALSPSKDMNEPLLSLVYIQNKRFQICFLEFFLYKCDFEKWTDELLEDKTRFEEVSTMKLLESTRTAWGD
jgi:hypothetical protein